MKATAVGGDAGADEDGVSTRGLLRTEARVVSQQTKTKTKTKTKIMIMIMIAVVAFRNREACGWRVGQPRGPRKVGKAESQLGGRWRMGPQDGWRVDGSTRAFGRLAFLALQAPMGVVGTPPSSTQTQPYWVLLRELGS